MGKKWHSCIKQVSAKNKRTGYKGNPYAICTAKVGRLNAKKTPPQGFAFIDWKDSLGKTWKDVVPAFDLHRLQMNILGKGGKVMKVKK